MTLLVSSTVAESNDVRTVKLPQLRRLPPILAVYFILALYRINQQSLWEDEYNRDAFSVNIEPCVLRDIRALNGAGFGTATRKRNITELSGLANVTHVC
jgi:hypothetical protein